MDLDGHIFLKTLEVFSYYLIKYAFCSFIHLFSLCNSHNTLIHLMVSHRSYRLFLLFFFFLFPLTVLINRPVFKPRTSFFCFTSPIFEALYCIFHFINWNLQLHYFCLVVFMISFLKFITEMNKCFPDFIDLSIFSYNSGSLFWIPL
jgi:hypothetical protein